MNQAEDRQTLPAERIVRLSQGPEGKGRPQPGVSRPQAIGGLESGTPVPTLRQPFVELREGMEVGRLLGGEPGRLAMGVEQRGVLAFLDTQDAVADGAGAVEFRPAGRAAQRLELALRLVGGDPACRERFQIRGAEGSGLSAHFAPARSTSVER